ncbi:uncharacterized protein LOC110309873 [Mus caroli]|uniref:Uncharacterized protein LOC110309873 n=1 Tax=Mus caroli TaxID=10089 RepID=A0A6P7PUY9_MUSCR|nr:uncharacterized protein LOC110309873 [Mus caroli]
MLADTPLAGDRVPNRPRLLVPARLGASPAVVRGITRSAPGPWSGNAQLGGCRNQTAPGGAPAGRSPLGPPRQRHGAHLAARTPRPMCRNRAGGCPLAKQEICSLGEREQGSSENKLQIGQRIL